MSVFIAQVHSVSLAIAEIFTVGAFSCLHPGTVSERLVAVLPDIYEIVFVDVTLSQVAADACTS